MSEQTLLHQVHAATGATFVDEAGWLLPAHFGDPAGEYRQACDSAALFDRSHHGKIEAVGKEAGIFLHNLSSNDVVNLAVGSGCEAFLATVKAKVVALVHVYRIGPETFWVDAGPGLGDKVCKHLDRFIISEQLELQERTRDFAQFHLAGPEARTILEKALQTEQPELNDLNVVTLPDGIQVRRHDCLSVPGYDLLIPRDRAENIWQALRAGGATPAGNEAFNILRIEAGTPLVGVDIDDSNLAMEVGRTERAISYKKGCFLGQEPIVRARDLGHVNWGLRGLRIPTGGVALAGAKLFRDGKEVGRVTSAAPSPRLGSIALAYIRRGNDAPATAVEMDVDGGRQQALVASLPFADAGATSKPPLS